MRTLRRAAACALMSSLAIGIPTAAAAPGDLDPAFSGDGAAHVGSPGGYSAMDVDEQGRVLLGSIVSSQSGGFDLTFARLLADGTSDPTFSYAVTEDGYENSLEALEVEPDGGFAAATIKGITGFQGDNQIAIEVRRYNPDGSPDTTFSSDGRAVIEGSGRPDLLAVLPDGRVVLAARRRGETRTGQLTHLWRFLPDGDPDPTLDGDGHVELPELADPSDLIVHDDGRMLMLGERNEDSAVALFRRLADGQPDPSFGSGGSAVVAPADAGFPGLALQPDGKLVVLLGQFVLRFNSDGARDAAFGRDGAIRLQQFTGAWDASAESPEVHRVFGNAVEVVPDGRIVVSGSGYAGPLSPTPDDVDDQGLAPGAARLLPSGCLDGSYGRNGLSIIGDLYVQRVSWWQGGADPFDAAVDRSGRALLMSVPRFEGDAQVTSVARLQTGGTGSCAATPAPGTKPEVVPEQIVRRLSDLVIKPRVFGRRGRPRATFRLSHDTAVELWFERRAPGRVVRGKCVRPSRKNRARRACTRWLRVRDSMTDHNGTAGANRVSLRRALISSRVRRGRYRLAARVATARNDAPVKTVRFRVR